MRKHCINDVEFNPLHILMALKPQFFSCENINHCVSSLVHEKWWKSKTIDQLLFKHGLWPTQTADFFYTKGGMMAFTGLDSIRR